MDTSVEKTYNAISDVLKKKQDNDYFDISLINKLTQVQILLLLEEYHKLCNDHLSWELKDIKERKAVYKDLNLKREQINELLENLIPKNANKKGGKHSLKILRHLPEALVLLVEFKKNQIESLLNKHKDKYKNIKRNDQIGEILFNEYELHEDKIDYRSMATIAISLIAHQSNPGFDSLYKIYSDLGNKRRKEIIADNT